MTFKEWFIQSGLTQEAAAELFKVSRITINNWIKGAYDIQKSKRPIVQEKTNGAVTVFHAG